MYFSFDELVKFIKPFESKNQQDIEKELWNPSISSAALYFFSLPYVENRSHLNDVFNENFDYVPKLYSRNAVNEIYDFSYINILDRLPFNKKPTFEKTLRSERNYAVSTSKFVYTNEIHFTIETMTTLAPKLFGMFKDCRFRKLRKDMQKIYGQLLFSVPDEVFK